jgi:hypothetical protein
MPKHERFEKLCSLAALGEVTPEEMIELHDHLRGCARCKTTLADFSSIIDDRLPLADPGRARVIPDASSDGLHQLRELLAGCFSWPQFSDSKSPRMAERVQLVSTSTPPPHSRFNRRPHNGCGRRWAGALRPTPKGRS